MILRHRRMRPKDVHECVEIIATHPVIGPRYGKTIEHLGPAWLQLLGREAMRTSLIESEEDGQATICFVGVSLCVHDDFVRDLKTPPIVWFGPELTKQVQRSDSPALTDKQVRECNSKDGLSLVVWEGCIRPGFETHTDLYREIIRAFLEDHQGFLWKELIAAQAESIDIRSAGSRFLARNNGRPTLLGEKALVGKRLESVRLHTQGRSHETPLQIRAHTCRGELPVKKLVLLGCSFAFLARLGSSGVVSRTPSVASSIVALVDSCCARW